MRQPICMPMGCAMLLILGACASHATRYTHGEVPRDTNGEPAWAEIDAAQPRPSHGPIHVPAGPPIRTVDGRPVPPAVP